MGTAGAAQQQPVTFSVTLVMNRLDRIAICDPLGLTLTQRGEGTGESYLDLLFTMN